MADVDVIDKEKKFLVRHFDSNRAMEDFINEAWPSYRATSIADTNSYVTVLLERVDGDD